jgi:3-oxoacyl-[acyl-carrier protein] reductase
MGLFMKHMPQLCIFFCTFSCICICAYAQEKTVVITCATGELGNEIATRLSSEYSLILTGRNREKLNCLQQKLENSSPHSVSSHSVSSHFLDYNDTCSVDSFCNYLKTSKKKLYGLVLMTPRPKPLQALAEKTEWQTLFDTCFIAPLEILKGFLANKEQHAKAVVISGISSVEVLTGYEASSILRHMLTTEVKVLSHILGPEGVNINTLSPGIVLTTHHREKIEQSARERNKSFDAMLEEAVQTTPLKRYASPADIAGVTRFLLSDDANHITGINVVCDGGKTVAF